MAGEQQPVSQPQPEEVRLPGEMPVTNVPTEPTTETPEDSVRLGGAVAEPLPPTSDPGQIPDDPPTQ
jgi:hypothetical protein